MLFDTHAHYDDPQFDPDRDALLTALPQQGVGLVLVPGCTLDSSRKAVELVHTYPHVYAAVGIHPENCHDFQPEQIDVLRRLAAEDKVVAIGEIGLDYYWPENPPKPLQHQALRSQLELAAELDLPVIIHSREAQGDLLSVLRDYPTVRGVFHCYAGSVEDARTLVRQGWMLSFNGVLTFKNARKAPEVVAEIPLEHLLIETDAPYLTPVPFRGKRNHSGYVHLVAERMAQIKNLPAEAVEAATLENGKRLFRIP